MGNNRIKISPSRILWISGIVVLLLSLYLNGMTARAETAYGYILPDSSWRTIDYAEIADMPVQVVSYAKNEIYARNGRKFISSELQNYFYEQYWYSAVFEPDQFSTDMLNSYEVANAQMLAVREEELGGYVLDSGYYDYGVIYEYMRVHQQNDTESDHFYVDPDSYILFDSDRRYISQSEIAQFSLQELNYARNEIYARRGRMFQSQELSSYFSLKNWYWGYIPTEQFNSDILNEYELANAEILANEEYGRQSGGYILDQPGYIYSGVGSYTQNYSYQSGTGDFLIWDSSIRYLSEGEVAGMSLQQLNYARNEIYARRGYIFQSQELRDYFESKNWYHGTVNGSHFSNSIFNQYEAANIELLKRYEYSLNPNGYQLY